MHALDAMPDYSGKPNGFMPEEDARMFTSILLTAALVVATALPATAHAAPPAATQGPQVTSHPVARNVPFGKGGPVERRPDTVLVKPKADATDAQVHALNAVYGRYGLRTDKRLLKGAALRLKARPGVGGSEELIAEHIMATGAVEFAEPDFELPPTMVPNDPLYPQQPHHPRINSPAAWDITQGNSGVIVAVCDGGFDLTHPELVARFVIPGYNTVKDNTEVDNIYFHGTMTSGAIAATGNNGLGVAGVAWNIRVLPIQVSDRADGVTTYSDVAECIQHAQDRGAKVVNISYDYTYTSAIIDDAALNFKNSGGLVVVAAGNSGSDISSWGNSDVLVLVGSLAANDTRSQFSNFGTSVNVYAPGEDILTTVSADSYSLASGTSFSAPLVAGALGLVYSVNPSWSGTEVEGFLMSQLTSVNGLGRLNVGASVQAANATMVPSPIELDNLAANVSDASRISTGKWCVSNDPGYFGERSLVSCGPKRDSYRFVPTITTAGTYTVYIRYVSKKNLSKKSTVAIKDATGTLTTTIDMRTNGGQWVSLGAFNLAAGNANYLEVSDGSGAVNIDGARFEFVQ